jgi:hypothetical protein
MKTPRLHQLESSQQSSNLARRALACIGAAVEGPRGKPKCACSPLKNPDEVPSRKASASSALFHCWLEARGSYDVCRPMPSAAASVNAASPSEATRFQPASVRSRKAKRT